MLLNDKTQAKRLLIRQLLVGLLTGLCLLPMGWIPAYSALLGGLIASLGSLYFASRIFVHYRAEQAGRLLTRLYLAEFGKLVIVAGLYAAVIILIDPLSIVALLAGYLCVQLIAPLIRF